MTDIKREKHTQAFHDYKQGADFDAVVIDIDGFSTVMVATDAQDNETTDRMADVIVDALRRMFTVYNAKGYEDDSWRTERI